MHTSTISYKKVYFLGIGGIGMSAIARYFHKRGVQVSGYDKTETALTRMLLEEGIHVHYDDNPSTAPLDVDIVIYTPAIPKNHGELCMYQNSKIPLIKRSEALGLISKDAFCIAVAGSHGKTTVSSMITHILKSSGYDCSAFLGGISVNYQSNYIEGNNNVVVVEADEYDRSFHKLSPDIAIITAVDTDHLDIYGTKEHIEDAFVIFTEKIKNKGCVVLQKDVQIQNRISKPIYTYALSDLTKSASLYTDSYVIENGIYHVTSIDKTNKKYSFTLGVSGYHNVENALAAMQVALLLEIPFEKIAMALATFKGIKRRFEYIYQSSSKIYIDDYAHHPQEIDVFLGSVREMYPGKKITAIFQPHLFSRTKDLYPEFAQSLLKADEVYILDIYPARELPMEGVTSRLIYNAMNKENTYCVSKDDVLDFLKKGNIEVLVTIGAGDIDTLIPKIKEWLESE